MVGYHWSALYGGGTIGVHYMLGVPYRCTIWWGYYRGALYGGGTMGANYVVGYHGGALYGGVP